MYKAIVLGGTGATGRELVLDLMASPKWSQVNVIARRKLYEWLSFDSKKFKYYEIDSFDNLNKQKKWHFDKINTLFNCLGPNKLFDKEQFKKVQHDYALETIRFAKSEFIKHYSIITAKGSTPYAYNYFHRIKGETENAIQHENPGAISIFRPGILTDRKIKKRFIDYAFKLIPNFVYPKVKAKQLATAMMIDAEMVHQKGKFHNQIEIYENSQIISLALQQYENTCV